MAVIGLFVPAVFAFTTVDPAQGTLTEESVLVAVALIVGYVLSLVYQFTNPAETLGGHGEPDGPWRAGLERRGRRSSCCSSRPALLAVLSEILVGSIEPFIESFGLSPFFVGVVLIPTIGNLAEHLVAVQLAAKDKMEFAMAVTYGSSLQVALFVAPVLVLHRRASSASRWTSSSRRSRSRRSRRRSGSARSSPSTASRTGSRARS